MTKERPVLYNTGTGRSIDGTVSGSSLPPRMPHPLFPITRFLSVPVRPAGAAVLALACLSGAVLPAAAETAETPVGTPPVPTTLPAVLAMAAPLAASPALTLGVEGETFVLDQKTAEGWLTVTTDLVRDTRAGAGLQPAGFCPDGPLAWCRLLLTENQAAGLRPDTRLTIRRETVQAALEQWDREKVRREPVQPVFEMKDGRVTAFALGDPGRALDIEASLVRIEEALVRSHVTPGSMSLPLPVVPLKQTDSESEAERLGIHELISEGRTNWTGSPKNRIHNFTHGAAQFHGLLIKPGEEFSFVEHLGPVDGEHGYLPELVIKHNKTTPEFGGGICQVSSTAFRAALNAGLKITERKNHAYPVQYYKPIGLDATIYIPKPDLRFVNNTPGHILIQTAVEGKELIFRFYGTRDDRQVHIDGPHVLERGGDGSMKTIFTQIVKDKGGTVLIEDSFRSNYASPSKYPHPGEEVFTEKPAGWSEKQWREYKASRG